MTPWIGNSVWRCESVDQSVGTIGFRSNEEASKVKHCPICGRKIIWEAHEEPEEKPRREEKAEKVKAK